MKVKENRIYENRKLAEVSLKSLCLNRFDIQEIEFRDGCFMDIYLNDTKIKNSLFDNCIFRRVYLNKSTLINTTFVNCIFVDCEFIDCDLMNNSFNYSRFFNSVWRRGTFSSNIMHYTINKDFVYDQTRIYKNMMKCSSFKYGEFQSLLFSKNNVEETVFLECEGGEITTISNTFTKMNAKFLNKSFKQREKPAVEQVVNISI